PTAGQTEYAQAEVLGRQHRPGAGRGAGADEHKPRQRHRRHLAAGGRDDVGGEHRGQRSHGPADRPSTASRFRGLAGARLLALAHGGTVVRWRGGTAPTFSTRTGPGCSTAPGTRVISREERG